MNIIKAERLCCRLVFERHHFRKKSFDSQSDFCGFINAYIVGTNEFVGAMPRWWSDKDLMNVEGMEKISNSVVRCTVKLPEPMWHIFTFEDYLKKRCTKADIGKLEISSDGVPKEYNQISILAIESFDNETGEKLLTNSDIEKAYNGVIKWCYRKKDDLFVFFGQVD